MSSLTNKTANIKYKKHISLQNCVRATESHIQKQQKSFFRKVEETNW